MYYTYILLSIKDNKFYTGTTNNLKRRFEEHNNGKVRSTVSRRPFKLIYYEACICKEDAFRREKYLKSGKGKRYLHNRLEKYSEFSPSERASLAIESWNGTSSVKLEKVR